MNYMSLFAFFFLFTAPAHSERFVNVAEDLELPATLKTHSYDVAMRSHDADMVTNVVSVGKQFHVNQIVWSYRVESNYFGDGSTLVDKVHDEGWLFGGAVNHNVLNSEDKEALAIEDIDGDFVEIPHLPGVFTGCVNKPAYEERYLFNVSNMVAAGVDMIQQDNTGAALSGLEEGACRCQNCEYLAGNAGYDLSDINDMEDFQTVCISSFYNDARQMHSGVCFSCNGKEVTPLTDCFDYSITEISSNENGKAAILYDIIHEQENAGRYAVFTAQDDLDVNTFRQSIISAFSVGTTFLVPWDQYIKNSTDRVFSIPEDYADLYGFSRATPHYQSGFCDAYRAGFAGFTTVASNVQDFQMIDPRYDTNMPPIVLQDGSSGVRVSAFARVVPGDVDAPIVVHIKDNYPNVNQRYVKMRYENFFGTGNRFTVQCFYPPVYNTDDHAFSERTQNYSHLASVTSLPVEELGDYGRVKTPAGLDYCVLVVEREGLVAHWSFESNVVDFGPYDFDLSRVGGCYSSLSMHGKNSLLLSGTNQYVHVADNDLFDIGTGSFAVALWMRRDPNSINNLRLLSKGAVTDTDTGYCFFGSDTKICAAVSDGYGRKILDGNHNGVGQWTHVVLNISRSENKMRLYLDGVLVDDGTISSGNIDSTHRLYIGRNASSANLYWDGRVDDVRVYKRSLSESEISIMAKRRL